MDIDGDSVMDVIDVCVDTLVGELVNSVGCSLI